MSTTPHLKRHLKAALTRSGLLSMTARLAKPRIALLKYHSIRDRPEAYEHSIGAGIIHTSAVFAEQMELVAKKFDPISMDDIWLSLNGEKQLPPRPVAVTFDDGYADNYEIAAPILNRFGISAAFYITVSSVDRGRPPWFCRVRHALGTTRTKIWRDSIGQCIRSIEDPGGRRKAFLTVSERCASTTGAEQEKVIVLFERELEVEALDAPDLMLDWDQVRCLHREGHVVGSHTMSHPNMAHVTQTEASWECTESKRRIETELKSAAHHFSYPSPILEPHWSAATLTATKTAGYRTAVTSHAGPVGPGDNPLALRRVAVASERMEFLWNLESTFLGRRL